MDRGLRQRSAGNGALRHVFLWTLALAALTAGYIYTFPADGDFVLRLYGFYLIDLLVIASLWRLHPLSLALPEDLMLFVIYSTLGGAAVLAAILYAWHTGPLSQSSEYLLFSEMSGGKKAAYALGMTMLTPLMEELLYRGMFYRILRGVRGPVVANLASTLIFSAMHGFSPVAFMQGILLAWVYERSGSVWGSASVHAANNVAWLLLFVA